MCSTAADLVTGVIELITDGLGVETSIQYAPTTASTDSAYYVGTVYKGHTRFPEDPLSVSLGEFRNVQSLGWPNAHFAGPIPVVYQFSADSGNGAAGTSAGSIRTTMQYWGLKMNRAGRGQLGFSEVRAWNDNSEIETRTRYGQQNFPFNGDVLTHEQRFRDHATIAASLAAGPASDSLLFDYSAACESTLWCPYITPQPNRAYNENAGYARVSLKTNMLGARVRPFGSSNVYVKYTRKATEDVHPVTNGIPGVSPYKRVVTETLANSTSTAELENAANTNAVDEWGHPGATRVTVNNGTTGGSAVTRDEHVSLTTGSFTTTKLNGAYQG